MARIHEYFGENLRALTEAKGTVTQVAHDLGIARGQYNRFLSGESFPKPHHLKQICDYFDVDARIMTEPLSDALLLSMRSDQVGKIGQRDPGIFEGINFVTSNQDYFSEIGGMKDGFYVLYRHSFSAKGKYGRVLLFIKTLQTARVIRGYDPRSLYPPGTSSKIRGFRGMVHRTADGHTIMIYHDPPGQWMSMIFASPVPHVSGIPAFYGFACIGRATMPGKSRLTDAYMEYMPGGLRQALRFKERAHIIDRDDLPQAAQVLSHAPYE